MSEHGPFEKDQQVYRANLDGRGNLVVVPYTVRASGPNDTAIHNPAVDHVDHYGSKYASAHFSTDEEKAVERYLLELQLTADRTARHAQSAREELEAGQQAVDAYRHPAIPEAEVEQPVEDTNV